MKLSTLEKLVNLPCYSSESKDILNNQGSETVKAYQENDSQKLTSLISGKRVFAHENHIFQLAA